MATFNKNEVVLEKVKQASLYDLESGILLNRLTSIEDPSLNTTAEKEEVVDAQGNTITDIYRAKKATFGGSNSLFSLDLAASQFGATKEVASAEKKIINYTAETVTIAGVNAKLSHTPVIEGKNAIKYVYIIESGEIGEPYKVGAAAKAATDTEIGEVTVANDGTITFPEGVSGKVYAEYAYESDEAVRVVNKTNESNAIIIGFNVRPDATAKADAEHDQVEMRMYRVIYDALEDVKAAMKGMLAPKFREVELGHAEVRSVFKLSSAGTVAGCYVKEGKVARHAKIRVVRDGIVIAEDEIQSLKRFKDDQREVAAGYECGIGLEKFNDIKEGDIFESFIMEEYRED